MFDPGKNKLYQKQNYKNIQNLLTFTLMSRFIRKIFQRQLKFHNQRIPKHV